MADISEIIPELERDEAQFVAQVLAGMTDEQAQRFALAYRAQRRDPLKVLALSLISFGVLGRIYLGQIGMGILYLFTFGLCGLGYLIDLVSFRSLTMKYNQDSAQRIAIAMSVVRPAGVQVPQAQNEPVAQSTPPATIESPSAVQPAAVQVPQTQNEPIVQSPAESSSSVDAGAQISMEQEVAAPDSQPAVAQEQQPSQALPMSEALIEELERLADLRDRGILTEDEFQAQKDRLLN